jgi:hypothetical protein
MANANQPNTRITLTDALGNQFTFGSMEVPSQIVTGGAQRLSVHELVGGVRVVDAMGRSDRPLEWSGLMLGASAIDRARYLDGLRVAGKPLNLAWGFFSYTVLLREFEATHEQSFQIRYRVTFEVVEDLTTPSTSPGATPIDQAISEDAIKAASKGAKINDPTLTTKLNALQKAIAAVSSFAHASKTTINSVLQPLADARKQVKVLIQSTANTIGSVTTFGGVLPNNPLAKSAANLTKQVVAVTGHSDLLALDNVLGRMGGNLGAINAPQNTVATAGGNLFQIAGKQYGDAQAWTGIAKANGMTDPFVAGAKVLTIPPKPDPANGVLGA